MALVVGFIALIVALMSYNMMTKTQTNTANTADAVSSNNDELVKIRIILEDLQKNGISVKI